MGSVVEVLKAGRELISDPKRWTQGVTARDAHKSPHPSWSKEAVCWCSVGALNRVLGVNESLLLNSPLGDRMAAWEFLNAASESQISEFNDSHTHEEVLAVWDKAIQLAESEQAAKS